MEINQKKAKSNLKGRQAEMVAKSIKKAEDAKKRKLARQKEVTEVLFCFTKKNIVIF